MYCAECLNNVKEYGELPLVCYVQICEYYLSAGKPIRLLHKENDRWIKSGIKFLELKGYIVSVDDGEGLQIKPLGHKQLSKTKHLFCTRGQEHVCRD